MKIYDKFHTNSSRKTVESPCHFYTQKVITDWPDRGVVLTFIRLGPTGHIRVTLSDKEADELAIALLSDTFSNIRAEAESRAKDKP
jgi:hypothetical protein